MKEIVSLITLLHVLVASVGSTMQAKLAKLAPPPSVLGCCIKNETHK
jgi:hypothetical protein